MTNARDILDSKLINGEIDEEQYRHLTALLERKGTDHTAPKPNQGPASPDSQNGQTSTPPPLPQNDTAKAPTPPAQTPAKPASKAGWIIGGAVASVVGLLVIVGFASVDGLSIGNLRTSGQTIEFKFANASTNAGDVVFWIEQNGMEMCERVMRTSSNTTYDVRFDCPTLSIGQFVVHNQWADFNDMAAVAQRIGVN